MKPADFCFDRTPDDFPSAMLDENDALSATAQAGARIRKLLIKIETRAHVYRTSAPGCVWKLLLNFGSPKSVLGNPHHEVRKSQNTFKKAFA